jgi:hypothetical protein
MATDRLARTFRQLAADKLTTSCDGTVQLADPYTASATQQQLGVLRDLAAGLIMSKTVRVPG